MSFLKDLIKDFTGNQKPQNEGPPGYYPPQQQYGSSQSYNGPPQQQYGSSQSYNGPPPISPPWIAEWDSRDSRWLYVNRETGERTFDHPQNRSYGPPTNQDYRGERQGEYYQQQPPKQSHTGRNVALGAVAGLAGGALLMHEGEKVEEKWDEDKYRIDNDISNGVQDVEDFPEDAARWTGRKVGEVEDIPQDIENKWDDGVQDVEDIPEDVAGWAGRRVGDVERLGDEVDDSYDQGRDDARYGDNY
ncbi:hypothetical protein LTR84_003220 [Exophiala bonariae]|uniref:WW domain-containing protein n=1 Tax=Exophiala bonariae TaxID=1690606 RepID=A0AAV9N938_9EURO|nr:hypothetical protein LTR84_003220 [Exophiala bonariae]